MRIGLLSLILLGGLPSLYLIPFYSGHGYEVGGDLHNLHAFHNCEFRNAPYGVPGGECSDINAQIYPPLLYWTYVWTRSLDFYPATVLLWSTIMLASMTAVAVYWLKTGPLAIWFAALFASQFPLFFELERGNNNFVVVVVWTFASWCMARGRPFSGGLLSGLAVSLKIFPLFACVAFVGTWCLALIIKASTASVKERRIELFKYIAGGSLAIALSLVAFAGDSMVYLTQVLPIWSQHEQGRVISVHGLFSIFAERPERYFAAAFFGFALLASYVLSFRSLILREMELAMAAALAISTYFAKTANDYSLVTAYPFFYVLLRRFLRDGHGLNFAVLIGGFVTVLGYRHLWFNDLWDFAGTHIALQVCWFVAAFHFLKREHEQQRSQ